MVGTIVYALTILEVCLLHLDWFRFLPLNSSQRPSDSDIFLQLTDVRAAPDRRTIQRKRQQEAQVKTPALIVAPLRSPRTSKSTKRV
jgi:hypothetical protein